jgi:hypothetical protein
MEKNRAFYRTGRGFVPEDDADVIGICAAYGRLVTAYAGVKISRTG